MALVASGSAANRPADSRHSVRVCSSMNRRLGSSRNSAWSLSSLVFSRIRVGQCQVPSATNCAANSSARPWSKVSTARRSICTSTVPDRSTGFMTSFLMIGPITWSANGIRNGGAFRGGLAATAARISPSSVEHPASTPVPGPRCSMDLIPALDAARTSIPPGR